MTNTDRIRTALADRYRIEREIGSGGMATVYLADDLKHHRKVAVKVLRPDLAATMGPDRFLREIEVAARLTHPHILPLHDSGEADGFLFYVMPYIEGESLRSKLSRQGELPVMEAVRILRDVVDALASAHRQGVVHRDIKPDNVLLSENHAVVTDFGVAKAVSEATGRQQLTTAGVALGTPAYMAPEQASADPHLDHRVDIYAVGAMAYELLTGAPPFTGTTAQQVLSAHVTQAPKLVTETRESVPPALGQFVMRCLEKKPADRWQTTEEMLPQLEALATPSGGITPTTTQPVRAAPSAPPWRTGAIAAAAVAIIAIGAFFVLSRDTGLQPLEFGNTQQVTRESGLEVDPALSPDGRFVAYAAGPPTAMRLFVRPVSGGNPVAISEGSPGSHRYPRWSPDGSQVLFSAPGGLWTVPPLGGSPRAVVRDPEDKAVGWGTWSPDGERIAYIEIRRTYDGSLVVQSVGGQERRELVSTGDLHSPSWSPDGRFIAYVDGNSPYWYGTIMGNLGPSEVWVVPADGSAEAVAVTGGGHLHGSPSWMPDSRTLLLVSTRSGGLDVHRLRIDDRGRLADSLERVTTGIRASSVATAGGGGQLVYSVTTNTSNAWSVDVTGTRPVSVRDAVPVTTGTEHVEGLGVSPDGQWLVFDSDRGGNVDIWKVRATGGDPVRLTTDPADDFIPAFSWDGEWIAFHSWRTGNRDVFVMASDGSREEQVTDHPAMDAYASWAPDGERLVFQSDRSGRYELYTTARTAAGWSRPRQLTTGGAGWGDWSPDGQKTVYNHDLGIGAVDLATGEERVLAEHFERDGVRYDIRGPVWTPDGNRVVFKGLDEDGRASIWDIPAEGGTPRLLVAFDDPTRPFGRWEFATDGRRVYFTIDNRQSDIWVVDVVQGND